MSRKRREKKKGKKSSFMQSANVLSKNFRNFIKRLTRKSSSDWNSKIVQHPRQSDGHNCGPLIFKGYIYFQESVEDYCIYCNLVNCEKESEACTMAQCDSCKRWAHMPCITEGTNQDSLTDEKKGYNCKNCA
ncbi:unnamed protein product [Eretmochelys imbricata]